MTPPPAEDIMNGVLFVTRYLSALHLYVEPVLRLADPAAEAVDVGGVGHAEYVLQEAAPAEQQVLTLPPTQQLL